MAQFCSDECEKTGSICDFCTHYQDEYRDIYMVTDDNGRVLFAGNGICDIDGSETDATGGYNCDNFKCFNVKD